MGLEGVRQPLTVKRMAMREAMVILRIKRLLVAKPVGGE
jgi:hypothetical protein